MSFSVLAGPDFVFADESTASSISNIPLSGRVFSDFYAPANTPLDSSLLQISASFWLQVDPKFGESSSAHLTFTANEFATSATYGSATYPQFQPGLREGYLDYDSKTGFEIKAGRMILPWGKSDVINPTDFFSAKDYTFFNPDDEVKRIGSIGLSVGWTPLAGNSPFTLTGIVVPVFAQSLLLIAPSQIPSGVTISSTPVTPASTLSNTEAGMKLAYSGTFWDASVSVYRGWNHLPDYQVTSLSGSYPNMTVTAAQMFHRYTAVGTDGSVTAGKWIFRGESAYVWTENDNGQNPLIQPSHWDAVMGIERPLGEDFRAQAQFYSRYFPSYLSPALIGGSSVQAMVNQEVAQTNAMIQNYQEQWRPSLTGRLSYSSEVTHLASEAFLIFNLVGGDYLARLQASYSWTDAFKTTVGSDYYAGPVDRPLGALAPYSSVYTEARYVF